MGGIIGKFFYPFGITVVVAVLVSLFVSFTLDPMLSVGLEGPAVGAAEDAAGASATRSAPPTACMDVLHARLRAADPLGLQRRAAGASALPAYGHGFDADGRRDKASPRRWRRATLTPRGVVMAGGRGQLRRRAGAGAAGRQRVRARRPTRASPSWRCACRWARSLERTDAKVRAGRGHRARLARGASTSPPGSAAPGQRNQAWLNIALVDRKERKRSQKQVEDAIREAIAKIPGTDARVGFNRPIYVAILGSDPEGLARVAERVRRAR